MRENLWSLNQIKEWADSIIAQLAEPPMWVIELSMSSSTSEASLFAFEACDDFEPGMNTLCFMGYTRNEYLHQRLTFDEFDFAMATYFDTSNYTAPHEMEATNKTKK